MSREQGVDRGTDLAGRRYPEYENCRLCPRKCGVNRYERTGFCGCGAELKVARAALHAWEEPCLTGKGGCGAVFFSGCTLRCCFCQNAEISAKGFGREISTARLVEIFQELEEEGAECLDLVTPTQYLPQVVEALTVTSEKRCIPVVYNCGGYESVETLRRLSGLVDIYLPDFKYADPARGQKYSAAPDYPEVAIRAIQEMLRQVGGPVFDGEGRMKRGVLLRHLIMPGGRRDSLRCLKLLRESLPEGKWLISLLRQFTPTSGCEEYPELKRRLTGFEYESVLAEALRLGLDEGYSQEKSSAKEEYIPPFDLEGV